MGPAAMKVLARHSDLRLMSGPYMDNSRAALNRSGEQWPSVSIPECSAHRCAHPMVANGSNSSLHVAPLPFDFDQGRWLQSRLTGSSSKNGDMGR